MADINPIESLQLSTKRQAVQLASDARLRLWSIDSDDISLNDIFIPETEWFNIITEDSDSEWIEILIPRYGRAFVACDSVEAVNIHDAQDEASHPRLTSLHLAFNHCELGALPTLMDTLGTSLLSLDIDAKEVGLVRTADVAAIIQSCPHLEMLSLNRAKIRSLRVFTQAYECNNSNISVLSLSNVEVSNESLSAFAKTLKDPSHAMNKTLKEFRYIYGGVGGPSEIPRPDSSAKAFLKALCHNTTLSFFEVGLAEGLYEQYAPKFRDLNARILVSHASDLPIQAKLAFLSCIQVVEPGKKKRARQCSSAADRRCLSRKLVADVFGFARKRILRVVSVTT